MDSIKKLPKINRNIILSAFLLLAIAFSVVTIVMAGAPDPGHLFTESSGNLILGDLIYGSGADTAAALAGNITVTKKFLNQTGNGSVSAAPVWSILAAGDIPDISGTYSAKAGNTSLVTVGTIGTGTWNADAIADGKIASALTGKTYNALTLTAAGTGFTIAGGTVSKTLTVTGDATISGTPLADPMTTIGDIIIRNGSNITARLAGAAGFLKGGVSTAPAWSTINLAASADVGTSILPVANGGTALSTFGGANTVLYTSAANTLTNVAVSTVAGQFLQTTAAGGAPTWLTTLGVANGGTGLTAAVSDAVLVGDSASAYTARALPASCAGTTAKLLYDSTTNLFSCGTDQTSAGGTTYVVTTADSASAAVTTYANITGLSWTVNASTRYDIECKILYAASATTIGLGIGWTGPASPLITSGQMVAGLSGGITVGGTVSIGNDTGLATASSVATAGNIATFHGFWSNGTTAGTLQMRFKPETATASGIIIKAGSWCKYSTY